MDSGSVIVIQGWFGMLVRALIIACGVAALAEAKHIKGIQIKNRGNERLWVEVTDEEGFYLPPGQLASIIVEDRWTGSIRPYPEECGKKTCSMPHTEAILVFQGEGNPDRYYVSTIEGFTRPMKIQPTSVDYVCKPALCHANILHHCPQTHQIKDSRGVVVACKPLPDVCRKQCPDAISAQEEIPSNTFACRSNTYMVVIG